MGHIGRCTATRLEKLVIQYQYTAAVIKATWMVSSSLERRRSR